jgi:hypothetical protein
VLYLSVPFGPGETEMTFCPRLDQFHTVTLASCVSESIRAIGWVSHHAKAAFPQT